MPATLSYPGVYIEEIPSGVRTITGVATSITAFVGRTTKGPANKAVRITSYGDFERIFGGLVVDYPMSYAIRDFFRNGGTDAVIVRLFNHLPLESQLAAAKEAANAVAATANGADIDAVISAIEAEAGKDEYKDEPKKSAAKYVVAAANAARAKPGATKETVIAAAKKASSFGKVALDIGSITIESAYPGGWGNALRATIDLNASAEVATRFKLDVSDLFNLTVTDTQTKQIEKFLNLSLKESPRRVDRVLKAESQLVRWAGTYPNPDSLPALPTGTTSDNLSKLEKTVDDKQKALNELLKKEPPASDSEKNTAKDELEEAKKPLNTAMTGDDSLPLALADYLGSPNAKTGIYALEDTDLFNLLCIPADIREEDTHKEVYAEALKYCDKRRAFLIVDPPQSWKAREALLSSPGVKLADDISLSGDQARNAAVYYPRVMQSDPLRDGQIQSFVPCGLIAGLMARTDVQRGVWKAPAGIDAALNGVQALEVDLTDRENGILNPVGINCLRTFPVFGRVMWGTRTLRGADQAADEYKYIPVRRTALFIEESLFRGLKWVVFEPNDEPLWAQIRLNVGAFMNNLFRQGAFQGRTAREAYLVKCDSETTTQNDINLGVVNVVVGFAPLKPAEFVVIKIQQLAGQIQV
jgi:hypothetical protein